MHRTRAGSTPGAVTHKRHIKPQGKHKIAQMMPAIPCFVSKSWLPAAHNANTGGRLVSIPHVHAWLYDSSLTLLLVRRSCGELWTLTLWWRAHLGKHLWRRVSWLGPRARGAHWLRGLSPGHAIRIRSLGVRVRLWGLRVWLRAWVSRRSLRGVGTCTLRRLPVRGRRMLWCFLVNHRIGGGVDAGK